MLIGISILEIPNINNIIIIIILYGQASASAHTLAHVNEHKKLNIILIDKLF